MLPVNILNALKDYTLAQTLAQKTLPVTADDAVAQTGQSFELGQKLQGNVQAQVAPNVFKVNVSGQLVQMELPPFIKSGDTVALQVIATQPRLTFSMVNSAAITGQPLELGQKLQGTIEAQVAPNVFKVNVSGRLVQMELPPSVKSGDTVALQVTSLQPRPAFSVINSATPLSTPEQLGAMSRLLSSMSQQAPEKAYVRATQSAPLWETPHPPESKQLAGMLKEALSNSGLFYESHQAQWLGGERTIAQLMHEPQNLTPEQARAAVGNPPGKALAASDIAGKPLVPGETVSNVLIAGETANKTSVASGTTSKTVMMGDASSKTAIAGDNSNPAPLASHTADTNAAKPLDAPSPLPDGKSLGIPDHLQPLVQQQLNALETSQMIWQGNIWPGQDMQWAVHEQAAQNPAVEGQRQWVTQIQLDLPNLGAVAATLCLNRAGLSLTLNADTPQTRAVLGNASTQLVSSLSDAGIPVLSAQVANELKNSPP